MTIPGFLFNFTTPAGAWLHTLDPIIFWRIRWYGLAYVAAFILALWWIRRLALKNRTPLQPQQAGDLVLFLALGVVIGARLGYVLIYQPALLMSFFPEPPFWGLLALNQGGMASHGGMLGVLLAAWIFSRRHRLPFLHLTDLAAFLTPIGFMFGRIANFINGELIGRPASPDLPWAVKFPQEIYEWPTEKILALREKLPPSEHINLHWQEWNRPNLIAAVQQGEAKVIEALEPMLTPRHPSQLYGVFLEGLFIFLALLLVWRKPRRAGIITGCYGMFYAVGRIINEFFRRPDPHIADAEFAWLNITRGQWLSGLLFLAGLMFVWYARKRKTDLLPLANA